MHMQNRFLTLKFTIRRWFQQEKVKEKFSQGVPQSQKGKRRQTAALSRHREEEETDKSKQAQIEQTYEKH